MSVGKTRTLGIPWITVVLLWLVPLVHAAEFKLVLCLTDIDETDGHATANLTCQPGKTIAVEQAVFGRSRWQICELTEDDCVERTTYFHSCDGLVICNKTFPVFLAKCGGDSTVLLLTYSCIRTQTEVVASTEATAANPDPQGSSPTTPRDRATRPGGGRGYLSEIDLEHEGGEEDIGVVIGCALAALVTIVMLIIAIVLVIRALLQYYKKGKEGDPPGRVVSCMDSVCLRVDRLPCFCSQEPENQSLRSRKHANGSSVGSDGGDSGGGNSRRRRTDFGATRHSSKLPSDRMAPVGQECSNHGSSTSIDSGLDEMQSGSNTSSPGSRGLQGSAPTTAPDSRGADVADPNNITLRDTTTVPALRNSSLQTKNCPDKVSSWREKELSNAALVGHKDNNQNVDQSTHAMAASGDDNREQMPKFDALALPNTYATTAC